MTTQVKSYIELSDIVAMRFECRQCQTTFSFLLTEKCDLRKFADCPNCAATWVGRAMPPETSIEHEIMDVIRSVNNLRSILGKDGKFSTKLALTLEVATPPAKD